MSKLFCYIVLFHLNLSFICTNVIAKEVVYPTNLDKVLEQENFTLVGKTTFSILFWDLYQSDLLTTSGNYPIQGNNDKLIFNIHYLTDISSDDLIKRTVEQWQHLGLTPNEYKLYLPILARIWPDINKGDRLSLFINYNQSSFYLNYKFIGKIDSPAFSQIFLDIWLSDNTSQPELRLELLGKNNA
jgi:hypothetical protein